MIEAYIRFISEGVDRGNGAPLESGQFFPVHKLALVSQFEDDRCFIYLTR